MVRFFIYIYIYFFFFGRGGGGWLFYGRVVFCDLGELS